MVKKRVTAKRRRVQVKKAKASVSWVESLTGKDAAWWVSEIQGLITKYSYKTKDPWHKVTREEKVMMGLVKQTGNICESHLLFAILGESEAPERINRAIFLTFKQGIAFTTMLIIVSLWREKNGLPPLNYDIRTLSEQPRDKLLELATEMIADLKRIGCGKREFK